MLVFPCFLLVIRKLRFFDVSYHFQDALFILPCLFVPFVSFLNDWFKVLAIQISREMVEGEEILDRGHLGRFTNASLRIHLT